MVVIGLKDRCMIREAVEVEAQAQDGTLQPGAGKARGHVHPNINSLTPAECPTVQCDITQK